jgi:hypothetical protein
MVVVPHHIEHDRNALVDCLLVQPIFAARSEQAKEVLAVKAIDEMLGDVLLSPPQARFV